MSRQSPQLDFLQFLVGGCLFSAGGFLLANQVMVRSALVYEGSRGRYGGWGSFAGGVIPWGTPGMGLLMIPLAIGVCLMFAGAYRRWANLLVWGSLAALFVGVLNSIRMTFMPATLWQLGVNVVMLAAGAGLMFRSLNGYSDRPSHPSNPSNPTEDMSDLRRELDELRRRLDRDDSRH
jgi:hypothetical protein